MRKTIIVMRILMSESPASYPAFSRYHDASQFGAK
ncbi:hypothetical protein QO004_000545 [Rhizobium mesoamericanum]|nr:hypothetical protein [Rhizobium mesoamericanum]